jgi:hypothetical protein
MIKQTARLSVIALLLLTLLLGACIAPDGTPLSQNAAQPVIESSEGQSVADLLGQQETATEAESSETGQGLAQADANAKDVALSTPELIEDAYAAGEISAEERVLYLAYAVYESESLPPTYQSDAPWRGTVIVRELNELLRSPAFCEMSPEIQSELERLIGEPACKSS